jgi:hypothetical protein
MKILEATSCLIENPLIEAGMASIREAAAVDLPFKPTQIRAVYPMNYSLTADRLTRNNTYYPLCFFIIMD